MNSWRFLTRRLVVSVSVLFIITLITFVLTYIIPADPLSMVLSERAQTNSGIVQMYKARYGLDRPPLMRYLIYVGHLMRGDFGESLATSRPVSADLYQYLPATAELAIAAMCIATAVGVPLGMLAAVRRDGWIDYLARAGSMVGVSFPVFWLGLLALAVLYYRFGVLPGPGRLDALTLPPPTGTGLLTVDSLFFGRWDVFVDAVRHLILPAVVLGAYAMGFITRITRASMLETLNQDFVRTARAKGLRKGAIVCRHVLRNAAIPTITMIGLMFGNLMSGAVVTETVFAWPGLGRYAVYAASRLDYPSIMGVTLVIALAYVTINFAVDLSYAAVDPRVRLE